jgi:hypothetical protein
MQYPHSNPDVQAVSDQANLAPEEADKVSKAEANYRNAGSSDTTCGSCRHYLGDGICELVDGLVSTKGVSDLWEPRGRGLADLMEG